MESCVSTAAATRRAASAAHPDFALKSDPIRFVGEARLPLGQVHGEVLPHLLSHAFPAFDCFAWHENTMAFTGAWRAAGFSAASLADRPASSPPPPNSVHFISEDVPFFEWWPHPIAMLTTHWDCAPMARCLQDAARSRHHADGTLAAVVKHADNLLKTYATAVAIILTAIITSVQTGVAPSPGFLRGMSLVLTSIFLYNIDVKELWRRGKKAQPPVEGAH